MTEKTQQINAPLAPGSQSNKFGITKEKLLEIVHLDNRPKHGSLEAGVASRIIMEEIGGPDKIAKALMSDVETGIKFNDQERVDRVEAFGPNSFPPPHIKTLWELIMENFEDQINQILLAAALVSLVIGYIQHGFPKGLLEGTSIMIALCIIIVVSSGNNYASEQRLAKLIALNDEQEVAVYRKGNATETTTISYEDLVVGDLVFLEKGMKVPADCMLVSGQNIKCKEDALTGEPDEIDKTPLTAENYQIAKDSILFAKAEISNGKGNGIVLAVGEVTAAGIIKKKVQEEGEETKLTLLQQKLNTIAEQIGTVGYWCAGLTFFCILTRLLLENWEIINCGCKNLVTCEAPEMVEKKIVGCDQLDILDFKNRFYTELLNTIIIAITVIVVAIPEGLPLAVTISLSFSSAKMQKENNLVRQLASAETMGSVTHICSDKTGTLTQNKMTTMACMSHQQQFITKQDNPDVPKLANDVKTSIGEKGWQILSECAIWNSEARLEVPEKKDKNEGYTGVENNTLEFQGNVTDQGILKFFAGVMGKEGVRDSQMSLTKEKILTAIPFDSRRKRATKVVKMTDGTVRVYTKGAPDVLYGKNKEQVDKLELEIQEQNKTFSQAKNQAIADKQVGCGMVKYVMTSGKVEGWQDKTSTDMPIKSLQGILDLTGSQSPDHEDIFKATVKDFAKEAYRTILCCYRDMSQGEYDQLKQQHNNFELESDRECLTQELIAIGLFGIQDPLRDTIVESVKQVKKAGIKVIMCTGDNLDTATAISKNAGIIDDHMINTYPLYSRMEGKDFREVVGGLKKSRDAACTETDPKKQKWIEYVGNQGKFNEVIKQLRVLGRSSPEDKYLLVTGLQASPYHAEVSGDLESGAPTSAKKNYCSVAVTGDGTNDAPALSKANVGFSMGITGTDIAKGASDIVLLDDNFASIITALKYGRNIYDNVRKFIQFQLTVNIVAMFIVFFGSLMLSDSPLTAVQMLWVNLIMDTLAALALATEPPEDTILERQPQPSSTSIVTEIMWRNVHGHAIYQMIVLIVVLFCAQGVLVPVYDIKCLAERKDNGPCPVGGLNAFYAADHYFELETEKFWKTVEAKSNVFEEESWVAYQCAKLVENHSAILINNLPQTTRTRQLINRMTGKECNKDNYKTLLTTALATLKDGEAKLLGTEGDQKYYFPQKAKKGSGTEKLLHMTYVFQIFVFMQIFNQLNARILTDSFNIFEGICRNWLFIAVALSTFVVQMAMVEVGGRPVKTYPLELWRNGICLIFGAGELIWGVLIKFLPPKYFQCINFEEAPMTEEQQEKSLMGKMKKGSSVHKSAKAMKVEKVVGNSLVAQVQERMAQNQTNQE